MNTLYDLIIVGGGPAGITAGIYAARQNLKTLLIAKNFGGQMTRKTVVIENYTGFEEISGHELIQKFQKHLKKQKIEIEFDETSGIKKEDVNFSVSTRGGNQFFSKAVIVATGAEPRFLNIPGEEGFIGRGVSYCVACDGPLFPKKILAVIGGGNSGFEAALFLANLAKKIYILDSSPNVRADAIIQKKAEETKKIEIITDAVPKEILGEKFVNTLVYQDVKTGETKNLPVDGIFIEIGLQPASSFIRNLVDFNEKNEIITDPETNQTKTPGLFAAGDVASALYKQIIISAGDGAKAALSASNYLKLIIQKPPAKT